MDSRRAFHRARLPLCIIAAFVAHGVAAAGLPAHAHRAVAAVLADALALPVDMESEGTPATERASEITERAAAVAVPSPRARSEARARPTPAAAKETVANPEDSASESTEPSTGGGWSDGDGVNGTGSGARGGGAAGGARAGHDHHALGAIGAGTSARHGMRGKAGLQPGRDWSDCPFPKDAQRRTAFVRIVVVVDASGEAHDVKVLSDPGEGFGESATACAMRRHYVAGTNDQGDKDETETEPFLVYFTR